MYARYPKIPLYDHTGLETGQHKITISRKGIFSLLIYLLFYVTRQPKQRIEGTWMRTSTARRRSIGQPINLKSRLDHIQGAHKRGSNGSCSSTIAAGERLYTPENKTMAFEARTPKGETGKYLQSINNQWITLMKKQKFKQSQFSGINARKK